MENTDDKGQEHDLIIKGVYTYKICNLAFFLLNTGRSTLRTLSQLREVSSARHMETPVSCNGIKEDSPKLSSTIATRILQRCILRQDWLTIALNCAYKILHAKLQIMRKRSHFLLRFQTKRCKLSHRSKTHKKIWRTSLRWKKCLCALKLHKTSKRQS